MNLKSKKILITGYFGNDNFGDELILQKSIEDLHKGNNIVAVASSDPITTRKFYKLQTFYKFNPIDILRKTIWCNVLYYPGGGIFQDQTSVLSLLYYLFQILIAKLLRKKILIHRIGVGPISSKLCRLLTKIALRNCELTVRDKKSQVFLKEIGVRRTIKIEPDLALKLALPKQRYKKRKKIIGIQLRPWDNIHTIITSLTDVLNLELNHEEYLFIYLLPFEICDIKILINFSKNLNHKNKFIFDNTVKPMLNIFNQLDLLIGMRYHSLLLAKNAGIPFIGISYSEKTEALMENNDSWIDINNFDINKFKDEVRRKIIASLKTEN